jgi:flagellin
MAMGQGIKNANDGISIAQIADGALGEMGDILQSIRTNVLTAANGSQSQESRNAIQMEISGAVEALNDIARSTTYNGQTLLDGSFSNKQFAVGENSVIGLSIPGVTTLGGGETGSLSSLDVTTADGAQEALETVDQALDQLNRARSDVGSSQNQFASSINNLATSRINMEAARSQIEDVDLAEESMVLSQMKTLEKASLFALAQANETRKNSLVNLLG